MDTPPPSAISRYFALCYTVIILMASLYPFSGWRMTGIPVFDFYTYPLPYYQTVFDNTINLLAYIPLGFTIVLNTKNRWFGILLALTWGTTLSAGVEFLQQFLPSRVASNLDILSNSAGTLIGALIAALIPWHHIQQYLRIRHMWLRSSQWVDIGTIWLGLWLLTQMDATQPLFSMVSARSDLPQPISSPLASPTIFLMLLEMASVFLHIVSLALFASCLVRPRHAIPSVIWLVFGLGFLCKISAALLMLSPVQFFSWLNFNVLAGGGAAVWILTLLLRLPSRSRALIGCITLTFGLIISWSWPISPSFSAIASLLDWDYGHLLHFNALVSTIRTLWPYGALVILAGIAIRYR